MHECLYEKLGILAGMNYASLCSQREVQEARQQTLQALLAIRFPGNSENVWDSKNNRIVSKMNHETKLIDQYLKEARVSHHYLFLIQNRLNASNGKIDTYVSRNIVDTLQQLENQIELNTLCGAVEKLYGSFSWGNSRERLFSSEVICAFVVVCLYARWPDLKAISLENLVNAVDETSKSYQRSFAANISAAFEKILAGPLGAMDDITAIPSEKIRLFLAVFEEKMCYPSRELMMKCKLKSLEAFRQNYLRPALRQGLIMTYKDATLGRHIHYGLTHSGKKWQDFTVKKSD